jgi:hypothetical protein
MLGRLVSLTPMTPSGASTMDEYCAEAKQWSSTKPNFIFAGVESSEL